MRRTLLTLTLLLLTGTAWAAEPAANTNPVFGGGVCGNPFICAAAQGNAAPIIELANSCSSIRFGVGGTTFPAGTAFDSSNCMTSKETQKASVGFTMSIKCCIVPAGNNGQCQLTCTRYGLR